MYMCYNSIDVTVINIFPNVLHLSQIFNILLQYIKAIRIILWPPYETNVCTSDNKDIFSIII